MSAQTTPVDDEQPAREDDARADETPPPASAPFRPEIREALEPTCCGSGCDDCPF